jgi:hypothetical protein
MENREHAFQDYYPDHMAHCYGCGRLNEEGHQIKSYWDGEETVAHFQPEPRHTAIPGYVYGGLLASLIDCHGTGTAAAAGYRAENRAMDTEPPLRYLTASLHVDYLKQGNQGAKSCGRGMDRRGWGDHRQRRSGGRAGARSIGAGFVEEIKMRRQFYCRRNICIRALRRDSAFLSRSRNVQEVESAGDLKISCFLETCPSTSLDENSLRSGRI